MTVDLAVETSLIRQAADVLDDAADVLGQAAAGAGSRNTLVESSLGNSALGREVVGAANRRVLQAVEAADLLADVVTETATRLRTVAAAFEAAETTTIRPHR